MGNNFNLCDNSPMFYVCLSHVKILPADCLGKIETYRSFDGLYVKTYSFNIYRICCYYLVN